MIGIFDSGVGGLTVMRQLICHFPSTSMVYFGDTARVPYGDKSGETILQYSRENAAFLLSHNIELLVIACNSASAYSTLKDELSIPVIDVIEPAVEMAFEIGRKIGVLGTRATISSGIYEKKLKGLEVVSVACPLLVPIIEEHGLSHPSLDLFLKEYLAPLKQEKVDTVILGCTHYPFLKERIERELGCHVIDSGAALAKKARQFLPIEKRVPSYRFFVSDDPKKFSRLAKELVGELPGEVFSKEQEKCHAS